MKIREIGNKGGVGPENREKVITMINGVIKKEKDKNKK